MSIVIPDDIIQATRMSPEEFMREIAVFLFEKEKLVLGQASRLAGMNQLQFQHLLASRQIPVHYDENDFEQDLQLLRELNRL